MQNKVSVIIPIYNVEQYLEKCLDSVINQTYNNLEIICVNDCSPDNCAEILEKFAKQDSRVKIINREKNGGLSAARNTGLDVATGEYVYFLDSDDWIDLDYIEKMVEAIEKANVFIACNVNIIEEYGNQSLNFKIPACRYNSYFENNDAIYKMPWSVWSHIYQRELLEKNNIRFPEGYIYEDQLFQHIAKYYAKKVFVFFGSAYHYLIRQNSIMMTKRNNVVQAHINMWKLIEGFYKQFCSIENLAIKLFEIVRLLGMNTEEEFKQVKEYLLSIKEYLDKKYYFFSDYELFLIRNILTSDCELAFKKKVGKDPFVTYIRQEKMRR